MDSNGCTDAAALAAKRAPTTEWANAQVEGGDAANSAPPPSPSSPRESSD